MQKKSGKLSYVQKPIFHIDCDILDAMQNVKHILNFICHCSFFNLWYLGVVRVNSAHKNQTPIERIARPFPNIWHK